MKKSEIRNSKSKIVIGAVAQLGEHLLCKQGVSGSIPLSSTKLLEIQDSIFKIYYFEC
jgi:hypothetical protein